MATGSKRVIFAALIGSSLIAVTKFVAAFITGSSAKLSEGIHSLVDTGNQVRLLHGLRRAELPADEDFPFGHGKLNEVLTMHMGPDFILANISVQFSGSLSSVGVERVVAGLDATIKTRFPQIRRIFIAAEKGSSPPPAAGASLP